ncbi:MAG TPA: ATP-binding protein [Spirochaetes bacterium]|nr:ATP-binding protein [Spirochaetota bacterium]
MPATRETSIEPEILSAINRGSDIVFVSYSMLDLTEEKIRYALGKILEKYGKEELLTPLFSCIKELISNATKANAKQILFEEGIINKDDTIMEIVKKLKNILNEEGLLSYGVKSKLKKLSTRTFLKVYRDNLIIEVINNLPLSEKDMKRIKERIETASHYDSIAEFYMENPDPAAEGMGLGLSMVVLLLKSINVNYRNFTVTSDGARKTYARVTIPLLQI